jgi:hypothetical protein
MGKAPQQYARGLLVQETFKNGLSFYFEYEGRGPEARCVRIWGDEGLYDHKLVYDLDARRTVVTNSLGHGWHHGYDLYIDAEHGLALGGLVAVGYEHGLAEWPVVLGNVFYPHNAQGANYSTNGNHLKGLQTAGGNKVVMNDVAGAQTILLSNSNNKGTAIQVSFKGDGSVSITTNEPINLTAGGDSTLTAKKNIVAETGEAPPHRGAEDRVGAGVAAAFCRRPLKSHLPPYSNPKKRGARPSSTLMGSRVFSMLAFRS